MSDTITIYACISELNGDRPRTYRLVEVRVKETAKRFTVLSPRPEGIHDSYLDKNSDGSPRPNSFELVCYGRTKDEAVASAIGVQVGKAGVFKKQLARVNGFIATLEDLRDSLEEDGENREHE